MHKVEQCDREVAKAFMEYACEVDGTPTSFAAFLTGEEDGHFAVQAFAAHRIAAIERCARVARQHAREAWDIASREGQNGACASGRNHGARQIEADIIALKGGA